MTARSDDTGPATPTWLVDQLIAQGELDDPRWRQAFIDVPREVFVPAIAVMEGPPENPSMRLLRNDPPDQHTEWAQTVYTDRTLITQINGQPVEQAFTAGTPKPGDWTSSSTAPSLMAAMLRTLDLHDGMHVLDVGTGTGYNTALLCHRLGADHVTSIDVDPALTQLAHNRLTRLGYHPKLITADGASGYPDNAPYDRIIASVSFRYLPPAWLTQTRPSGTILTNVLGHLGGAMLLATMDDNGTATGHFQPTQMAFMPSRGTFGRLRDITAVDTEDGTYDTGTTTIDTSLLRDPAFGFCAQVHLTDTRPYWSHHPDGRPLTGLLATDGSWAEVYPPDDHGRRLVEQGGPRRLWTEIEHAHRWWQDHHRPDWTAFGLTATTDDQFMWYEHHDGDHRWPLYPPPQSTGEDG